ncbi:MAG: hypothetical protein AAFU50_08725, partial [Pseudomonadota bacterium]
MLSAICDFDRENNNKVGDLTPDQALQTRENLMLQLRLTTAAFAALAFSATGAYAACGIEGGRVNIIGNEFPAIQTIGAGAKACSG